MKPISITPEDLIRLKELFHQIKVQLSISDQYAKQNKPKTDLLPSVWEMQNMHVRDLLNECNEFVENKNQIR